jgi:predicted nucleotidyltransferase
MHVGTRSAFGGQSGRSSGDEHDTIAAYENGERRPAPEDLVRIMKAADTRPSVLLAVYADEVIAAAHRFRLENVRVFGSTIRGHDTADSDIDLLVSLTPATSLFDLGGFAHATECITGFPVDVLTDDLHDDVHFRHVMDEAVPL